MEKSEFRFKLDRFKLDRSKLDRFKLDRFKLDRWILNIKNIKYKSLFLLLL